MPAHPRSPRCVKPRCVTIVFGADLCQSHLIKEMDLRARDYVHARDGMRCQETAPHECKGPINWAHTETRKSKATRWLMEGAVDLCESRHGYYTRRERLWYQWCERRFGHERWTAITAHADRGNGRPWKAADYVAIFELLKLGPVTLDDVVELTYAVA